MSINRGKDKDVVHIYNGIILSHKKEWNWVIFRNVHESRLCHAEWSKSERDTKYKSERDTKMYLGGSDSKESAFSAREPGSVSGLGRSPGEGNGYPLLGA